MNTIHKWLFPEKSKWIDIACYDRMGHYYLIQMRYTIDTNRKEFRVAKIGFVNDYIRKPVIFANILSDPQLP